MQRNPQKPNANHKHTVYCTFEKGLNAVYNVIVYV